MPNIFLFSAADLYEAIYSSNVAINACLVSVIVSVVVKTCLTLTDFRSSRVFI